MQIELHRNNVYQGVELLLLVPMLFLLAIPKCLLIFKVNFYYTSIHVHCTALVGYLLQWQYYYPTMMMIYHIAGNFGGKTIWRIVLIRAFGRVYFGGWVSLIPYLYS